MPAVAATLLALAVGGCAQPHADSVEQAASAFYQAHASRDGARACAHLAPGTRSELEKSAGKPCPEAILEEDVPPATGPDGVSVFGTQAEVRWAAETTFLARFQDGWKVMAAACRPQKGRPYDCLISGG
jgi:hypothetical protein